MIYLLVGTDAITGARDPLGTFDNRHIAEQAARELSVVMRHVYSTIDIISARDDGELGQEHVACVCWQGNELCCEWMGSHVDEGTLVLMRKTGEGDETTFEDGGRQVKAAPLSLRMKKFAMAEEPVEQNLTISKENSQNLSIGYSLKFLIVCCLLAAGLGAGSLWIVLALL